MKVDATAASPYQKKQNKKNEAPAINDPSSHRRAVTSAETTSPDETKSFSLSFFFSGLVLVELLFLSWWRWLLTHRRLTWQPSHFPVSFTRHVYKKIKEKKEANKI